MGDEAEPGCVAGSEAAGCCAPAELAMSERKKTVAVASCILISGLGEVCVACWHLCRRLVWLADLTWISPAADEASRLTEVVAP